MLSQPPVSESCRQATRSLLTAGENGLLREMGNDRAEFYRRPFGSGSQSVPDTLSLSLYPLQMMGLSEEDGLRGDADDNTLQLKIKKCLVIQ